MFKNGSFSNKNTKTPYSLLKTNPQNKVFTHKKNVWNIGHEKMGHLFVGKSSHLVVDSTKWERDYKVFKQELEKGLESLQTLENLHKRGYAYILHLNNPSHEDWKTNEDRRKELIFALNQYVRCINDILLDKRLTEVFKEKMKTSSQPCIFDRIEKAQEVISKNLLRGVPSFSGMESPLTRTYELFSAWKEINPKYGGRLGSPREVFWKWIKKKEYHNYYYNNEPRTITYDLLKKGWKEMELESYLPIKKPPL